MIITPSGVYPPEPSAAVVSILFIASRVHERFPECARRDDASALFLPRVCQVVSKAPGQTNQNEHVRSLVPGVSAMGFSRRGRTLEESGRPWRVYDRKSKEHIGDFDHFGSALGSGHGGME